MLQGHGDDLYRHNKIKWNFSSNVWYGGAPPLLMEHLKSSVLKIENYPDPEAKSLGEKLAAFHCLPHETVQITSGATEAIYLICRLFQNKKALVVAPAFREYEDACRASGVRVEYFFFPGYQTKEKQTTEQWQNEFTDAIKPHDVIFLCNPNNPTGDLVDSGFIESLAQKFPEKIFVIDEAYIDFCTAASMLEKSLPENIIVIKSMTKSFAIPGLRLGYFVSSPDLYQKIQTLRMPWSVSSLAIEAGHWILEQNYRLPFQVEDLLLQSKTFFNEINSLKGYTPIASSTHYFLVRLENPVSTDLKNKLAADYQILIRDASNFTGLDPHWIRLATRFEKENTILVNALRELQDKI